MISSSTRALRPGGKATAMARRAGHCPRPTAHRAALVVGNALRGGHPEVHVGVADGRQLPIATGRADRVLIDAPCSGLGVLARRADARWRIEADDVGRLAICSANSSPRPGGLSGLAACSSTASARSPRPRLRGSTTGSRASTAISRRFRLAIPGSRSVGGGASCRRPMAPTVCTSSGYKPRRFSAVVRIAPSILSADFANLAGAIDAVMPEADTLHVDVMDGHFVPNITIGPPVVRSLRKHTDLYLDCHLMITNPGEYLTAFKEAGADGCSVHVEVGETGALIDQLRALGLDAGLVVNPETPIEAALPFLDRIDLLLLMTVHPGFGGQKFISDVMSKVETVRAEVDRRGLPLAIQVDGGIDERTAPIAAAAGADVFVAGNAIFGNADPRAAAARIRAAATTTP